ncbi:cobaltochelatase subunit CobN [Saccharobesus litoralis]|uniref:Cobaltochelatase subunit CobN n=1 Tax=Saccharobesus litoralis TaxID=2172099 RepID=A0A2S0VNP0_9ALTE|nr:cobaltochelatase subunit CobN [Saccharobesus litoralis]AWB65802.1 cobaltochelatase subunit CobN [Saccharobesus litoralis]
MKPITKLISLLLVVFGFCLPLQAEPQEQSIKPQVLLLGSSHAAKAKSDLLANLAQGKNFDLKITTTAKLSEDELKAVWKNSALVMMDGINPALTQFMFAKYTPWLQQMPNVPVISLGDLNNQSLNQGLSKEHHQAIGAYFNNAGRQNYASLMDYIANRFIEFNPSVAIAKPFIVPNVGLYHPNYDGQVTKDESAFYQFLQASEAQPKIAIAMHRSIVDYEQQQIVDAMIKGLEDKGAKAFGFFFEGEDEDLTYPELLLGDNNQARVDLLINYRALHYVEKRRKEFTQIGVPVLHAMNYTEGSEADFKADNAGISPSLTPFFLVMPEDTGSADPTIIAASPKQGANAGNKVVIPYQMQALVERAYNHARLAHIDNSQKKVATFIWNYPPGEKNVGAAFLDVPSSIEQIATAMTEQGYKIAFPETESKGELKDWLIESAGLLLRPYYRNEDAEGLVAKGLADYLPLSTYLAWFNQLPEEVRTPIVERWGAPEQSSMLRKATINGQQVDAYVIPRLDLGNMIVMPQGLRGENAEESASLYHDTKEPANHTYLAIYLYAREQFGANAFIHLGTHGSQEWLSGKERGLSVYDAPNLVIGNLPVFYPYIIDNVGEAMQAKRRGRATMISHLTPGFAKAGLYADVAVLNEKLANYMILEAGQTKANTEKEIIKLAIELDMLKDLSANSGAMLSEDELKANFADYVATLQDHLNGLAAMSQPLGVHTFGVLPEDAHLYTTMLQMLGEEYVTRAAIYEKDQGLALEQPNNNSLERQSKEEGSPEPIGEADEDMQRLGVAELASLEGFQLLKASVNGEELKDLTPELEADLKQAQEYWDNFQAISEIENLLSALEGNYIPVSHGGDPIRNPNAAPTGRNLIGFNPAKVPTKEAYEAGVTLMNQTIDAYVAKHGRYPEKLAFSLWSLETMRHQGALEAQILHALGLKPKWDRQGNVSGTEVIEYKDLGRPRIDVVISATGLYRDAFPNVMLWLADAIDKVAKMKEENNFVYRNANQLKQTLLAEGKTEQDADYLSSVRIFSNETGNYGTGLASASLASGTWQDDSKLADLYTRRMGFAFGKDESRWSENVGGSDGNSDLYSKVLSGTEGVIFSRSTNLYAMMTNDDPFQYFGGIGLAVRNLDGKTPEMYVSNLRKKDQVKSQTLAQFVNQELRSRYFHPRWIKAMQDSGYAGATAILDRVNNLWGWEVMTPESIRDDQWQEFFEIYVDDKYQMDMREFFESNNAESLAQIIERMLEAERKDYWQTDEATIKKLVETYAELAVEFDVATNNDKFNEYMDQKLTGFGYQPLSEQLAALEPVPAMPASNSSAEMEQVQGQKLEKQSQQDVEIDNSFLYKSLLIMFLIMLVGAVYQARMGRVSGKNTNKVIQLAQQKLDKAA